MSQLDCDAHEAKMSAKKITAGEIPAFEGLESKLHEKIEQELIRRRWYYVRSRMDKKSTQPKGVPDFIIASPAKEYNPNQYPFTFWIEVKRKGSKLTKEQNITRHVLLALGHKWVRRLQLRRISEFHWQLKRPDISEKPVIVLRVSGGIILVD